MSPDGSSPWLRTAGVEDVGWRGPEKEPAELGGKPRTVGSWVPRESLEREEVTASWVICHQEAKQRAEKCPDAATGFGAWVTWRAASQEGDTEWSLE